MKIKSGYLDYFYVISSDDIVNVNDDLFEKYIKIIAKDKMRISAENSNYELFFTSSFESELRERIRDYRLKKSEGINSSEILSKSITLDDNLKVNLNSNSIQIIDESIDKLRESQSISLERLAHLLDMEKYYTGYHSKDSKNRFLIRPPEVLISNDIFIPTIILTVYKTGHILIHFSIELKNLDVSDLSSNKWDLEFNEVLFPKALIKGKNSFGKSNFHFLVEKYIEYFEKKFGIDNPIIYFFQHATLLDYSYNPDYFGKHNSKGFDEGIYRILYAPIFKHQLQSEQHCRESLEEHVFRFSKNYYLYAHFNRLISCISKNYEKDIEEQLKFNGINTNEVNNFAINNENKYRVTLESIINCVEDILIRKSTSALMNYTQWDINMPLNKLLDNEMKETEIYLFNYYKNFYGYESLSRLSYFILEKCENYLRFSKLSERREKIETIIKLKKEKIIYNATLLGPLMTIVLTTLFSYSALEGITKGLKISNALIPIYLSVNLVFNCILIVVFKSQLRELTYLLKKQLISLHWLSKFSRWFFLKLQHYYNILKNCIF